MEKINDGGPAFPLGHPEMTKLGQYVADAQGRTLRDYFASKALPECYQDYVSHAAIHGWEVGWRDGVATDAYAMADAMLKARKVQS